MRLLLKFISIALVLFVAGYAKSTEKTLKLAVPYHPEIKPYVLSGKQQNLIEENLTHHGDIYDELVSIYDQNLNLTQVYKHLIRFYAGDIYQKPVSIIVPYDVLDDVIEIHEVKILRKGTVIDKTHSAIYTFAGADTSYYRGKTYYLNDDNNLHITIPKVQPHDLVSIKYTLKKRPESLSRYVVPTTSLSLQHNIALKGVRRVILPKNVSLKYKGDIEPPKHLVSEKFLPIAGHILIKNFLTQIFMKF